MVDFFGRIRWRVDWNRESIRFNTYGYGSGDVEARRFNIKGQRHTQKELERVGLSLVSGLDENV